MTQILGLLALCLAIGIGLIALIRPTWAVVLLIMMWPIEQVLQTSIDFFAARSSIFNAYVGIIVALAAVVTFFRGKAAMRTYFNPVWIIAAVFYCWAGLSLLWTRLPSAGIRTSTWLLPYIVVALIGTPVCISRRADLAELRWGVMVSGCILACIILLHPSFSFYGDRAFVKFSSTERGNPLAIASLGAAMMVFAILSRDEGKGRLFLPIRIGAMVLGIALAVSTGSRGQLLAAGAVGLTLFPLVVSLRNLRATFFTLLALPVVAAIAWVAFFSFLSTKNIGRWSVDSLVEGVAGRVSLATGALSAYFKSPDAFLTGFGTMSFAVVVPEGGVDFCENMFVEALTDLGVIGFALLAAIIALGYRSAIRLRLDARDRDESVGAMSLLGIMTLEMLLGAKMYNIWTGFMPITLCVIACRIYLVEREAQLAEQDEFGDAFIDDADELGGEPFHDGAANPEQLQDSGHAAQVR